jgi:AcrR family transcriptional regulator
MLGKQESTGQRAGGGDAALGQRERNKRDKLQRIKSAARELFVTRGYDDTTTREIALRAGVGMGTVFTYADNKRDLLFLIANEDLEETTRRSEAALSPSASLMTNLMAVFGNHFEYFMRQPELSRLMLREMLFYDSGQQSVRFARENRSIAGSVDDALTGWVLFCIYQVELRSWLAGAALDLEAGLDHLRRALTVCLVGLSAEKPALNLSRRKR